MVQQMEPWLTAPVMPVQVVQVLTARVPSQPNPTTTAQIWADRSQLQRQAVVATVVMEQPVAAMAAVEQPVAVTAAVVLPAVAVEAHPLLRQESKINSKVNS